MFFSSDQLTPPHLAHFGAYIQQFWTGIFRFWIHQLRGVSHHISLNLYAEMQGLIPNIMSHVFIFSSEYVFGGK